MGDGRRHLVFADFIAERWPDRSLRIADVEARVAAVEHLAQVHDIHATQHGEAIQLQQLIHARAARLLGTVVDG